MALQHRTAAGATDADLLVAALRGDRFDPATTPSPTTQLVFAAQHHGVLLPLRRAYRAGFEGAGNDMLTTTARLLRSLSLRIAREAIVVSEVLRAADIRHAIVKGPAIATAYTNEDREFVDLDVLVAPREMSRAISQLERHGAVVLEDEGWPRSDGVGELGLGLPSGVAVDLHADLIHRPEVRRHFAFSVEPLLERATTAAVLDSEIPVLSPEDSCTYVALHAAISGGDRLIWFADLDALVRQGGIDWEMLIRRARDAKLALVVGVMLQRAATVVGTPVPEDVLTELQRRGRLWSRLVAGFESRRPVAANHGRLVRGQILVRSTRSSTLLSALELGRLIWRDVIMFVLTDSGHPWRARLRDRVRAVADKRR